MVDNQGNTFGVAPDKGYSLNACDGYISSNLNFTGVLNGPVTTQANLTTLLEHKNMTARNNYKRQTTDYWISELGSLGSVRVSAQKSVLVIS
jgi:hypothetical protein